MKVMNKSLGDVEFSQDGSMVNEIKIAEIIEMKCEEAQENNFYCLLQEGESRYHIYSFIKTNNYLNDVHIFRAEVVEVDTDPDDLDDDEVAQLTQSLDIDQYQIVKTSMQVYIAGVPKVLC